MHIRHLMFFVLAAIAPAAWAHGQGVHTHDAGLIAGMLHPFSGLDHLLVLIAVWLWATQQGGRALWALPLSFAGAMAIGAVLGMTGTVILLAGFGMLSSLAG